MLKDCIYFTISAFNTSIDNRFKPLIDLTYQITGGSGKYLGASGPKKCIKLYQFNTLFAFFIYKKGCRPNRKSILKCISFNTL